MGKVDDSTVTLDKSGVIHVTVVGGVDEAMSSRLIGEVQRLTSELRAQDKKVLILSNLTRAGKIDSSARRLSKEFFRAAKYDRIAIFGANEENSLALGFLVRTISKVLRIRFFKTESRALLWLRLGQITLRSKARWILVVATGLALLAIGWHQYIAPYLLRLPDDFSYQASVISYDNFYNEQTASFSGKTASDTTFTYKAAGAHGSELDVKNLFDVRTTAGEKIFTVERTYGIERATQKHLSGHGDRDRNGYLFAPSHLAKQDFTYWHINYDEPALMKFQNEEDVLGLKTYQYMADYHADQTKDLTHLPGVGVSRGVTLDINLQLWVEPETGYLVKYEDHTTAYYYDLATGERLYPWNQFSNGYSFDSIADQVQHAEKAKQHQNVIGTIIPVGFAAAALVLLAFGIRLMIRHKSRRTTYSITRLCAASVVATGLTVVLGWIIHSSLLTRLHPSFSAMHILTALDFIIIGVIIWLMTWTRRTRRLTLSIWLLWGVVVVSATLYLARYFLGIELGIEPVLLALDLPSIVMISPVTAICFLMISVVLLITRGAGGRITRVAAQTLLVMVFGLVTFTIAGYVFSLGYLYSIGWFRAMALHTAILFTILIAGILAMHQDWGITRLLRRISKSLVLSVAVFTLLIGLTGLFWQQSISNANKQATIQFRGDTDSLQSTISNELSSYIKALQGAKGLFAASDEVERSEWTAYVGGLGLAQNYPGMQGIGFAQMISPTEKNAHVALIRSQGFPAYTIQPEGDRETYSSIVFLEPFNERNQRAFGYDMLTDPVRRAAMERARDTGEPAMTGRVTLLQETDTDRQAGLLIYLPIYKNGAARTTIEDRRSALVGYVYAPIRVTDFMRATVGEQTHGLNIGLFDTKTPKKLSLKDRLYIVDAQYGIENKTYHPKLVQVENLQVAGQTLTLRYSSLPNYDLGGGQTLPRLVLFGGLLLSLLLGLLTLLLSSSRNRALELAAAMTVDLRNERNLALANEQKDEAILNGINEGLIVFSRDGRIEKVNPAAQAMLGYKENELTGQLYKSTLMALDSEGSLVADENRPVDITLNQGKGLSNVDISYRRKDYTIFPVKLSIAPISLNGQVLGAIEIFRDTTREKQLEHMKDEFLSVASHELRTPMGAIRANIAMILSGDYGPVNKDLVEPLTDMRTSTVRLVELVNDLLNVARIEAGRMSFVLNDINIQEVLASVVSSLAPLGKEKNISISLSPGEAVTTQADEDKIKQVLTNLIGNALKFTDKGSITVAADPQKEAVEVTVNDTGIGIALEDQKKLFNKFSQINSTRDGKPAGTGLGLYISREIIRKMGGELWIKNSEPGRGSSFAFTIPRAQTPGAKQARRAIEREAELHPDQK